MAKKPKFDLPEATGGATCRSCGVLRRWDEYRLFRPGEAAQYMDFCSVCERQYGTLTLYRRFNAYGTPEIVEAVFAAERVPALRRTPEQVRLLLEPVSEAPKTNEELIKRELARRELCRRRLIYYATQFHPSYTPGWCHQDISRRLEQFVKDVEEQKSPRLMIFLPPRAGKSALASDLFPSWVLGKHPEWSIIASSYAQSLPLEFSRNIRDRLQDGEHQAVFPDTKLRPDAKGIEAWKTTKGGGYIAAGVGTGITGKGFNIGIVDDPIKDQEAADSEVIREAAFKWYQAVFRTRVAPGAGILFINTRWHWADPAGKLLDVDDQLAKAGVPEDERENWQVVSYPALAEYDEYLMHDGSIVEDANPEEALRLLRRKGEALHPERFSTKDMLRTKNGLSSSMWSALYQQRPTPDEGDYFKRDDFRYRWLDPAYRPLATIFITADYAIKKGQRNDWTVLSCFALTSDDDLYVLSIRRGRWGTYDIARNIVAMVKEFKPQVYAGEQGQIHEAVWPVVEAELTKERLFVSVDSTLTPIQDKGARARPLQGRMQRHKLFFSHDEFARPEIYDIAEREMLQFPEGTHDDIVDALAWGARLAQNLPLPTTHAPPSKRKSWKDPYAGDTSALGPMAA